MVKCCLDDEVKENVCVKKEDGEVKGPIYFTSYALVGLRNFYYQNPEVFRERLRKGPPPAYRWVAW